MWHQYHLSSQIIQKIQFTFTLHFVHIIPTLKNLEKVNTVSTNYKNLIQNIILLGSRFVTQTRDSSNDYEMFWLQQWHFECRGGSINPVDWNPLMFGTELIQGFDYLAESYVKIFVHYDLVNVLLVVSLHARAFLQSLSQVFFLQIEQCVRKDSGKRCHQVGIFILE